MMNNSSYSQSQKKSIPTNSNNLGGTANNCFGPGGCPAVVDGRRCGETRNLEIIKEFNKLYEAKMKQIDDVAGGDCIQAKISLQQEWIRDLSEQNELLVRVVEELEVEAAERVTMLEEKLQNSAKCACEVMESYRDFSINFLADFQKMERIQNDLNNLIEVLKRVKDHGLWSSTGLSFYTIDIEELMGNMGGVFTQKDCNKNLDCNCNWNEETSVNCKSEKLMKEKDRRLKELEEKIRKLNETIERNDEARRACQQYAELKKSMLDMRDALTAEVAEKHDTILCLRREVHLMEEQCRKAEQQTHFKDDIIKELRKEIKQLKLQRTKKSRSPRTVRKCEHRLIHPSRTDPDTNVHTFKEGTILIKDTSAGDTLAAKQVIKEKYADPSNQTVVYICESVTHNHKNKNREHAKVEPGCSQTQKEDVGNCEVTQDDSRGRPIRNVSDSRENSREISFDYPRDTSQDVTRDSPDNSMHKNFLVYPSIHETCIRYSKDILEMLNNHSLEEKKALDEYLVKDEECTSKPLEMIDVRCPKQPEYDGKVGEFKDFTKREIGEVKKEDSNSFLSNTLSHCEKYLLNMYRKKCNEQSEMEKGKYSGVDDSVCEQKHKCYCNQYTNENPLNSVTKYEEAVDHSPTRDKELKILEIHVKNGQHVREHNISFISSACQTVGHSHLNKNTQTSDSHLLNDSSSDHSISYVNVSESLIRDDDLTREVYENRPSAKENSQNTFPEDARPKDRVNVETLCTEELWNNANMKSDEVSFEESEIRAFSTPFYEDVHNYCQPEYVHPRRCDDFYHDSQLDEGKLFRYQQERRRLYEMPHVVPIRRYVLPPHARQAKMLSPRTIRKIPSRKIYHGDVPLSVRSHSLPICGEICAPGQELGKPVRVQKVKRQPNCAGGQSNYVDVAYMRDENGMGRKIVSNDLRGFVEMSQRNRVCNSGGKRFIREDAIDPFLKMNNTF